jgi:alpha-beta hydrolase superfamily lysophospholipase
LKGSTVALARQLGEHGLSVLMIDLRGHGASTRARLTYGVREREDVLGAVDYLLDRGYAPGAIGVAHPPTGTAPRHAARIDRWDRNAAGSKGGLRGGSLTASSARHHENTK